MYLTKSKVLQIEKEETKDDCLKCNQQYAKDWL